MPRNSFEASIQPRTWQRKLIQLLRRRLSNNLQGNFDILIHAGPGAGKTLGALLSFIAMKNEGKLSKFLVFCHRNSIVQQWLDSSKLLGLKVENYDSLIEQENSIDKVDGLAITYQSASRKSEHLLTEINSWKDKKILTIADEAHHLGLNPEEPQGPIWGETFLKLSNKSKLRLGLTGTPFRADNLAFCAARKIKINTENEQIEQINPDLSIESRELIEEGDVRPLEFRFQDGWVEHCRNGETNPKLSAISTEQRESWRARNLRRSIRLSDKSSVALQLLIKARKRLDRIRSIHPNAAGLVIARDIEHAKSIAQFLKEDGNQVELVHSQNKDSIELLKEFQNGNASWLVSIDMCAEGFNAPRLRVIAYLSTVVTKARFLQSITRAVRVSASRASIEPIPRHPSYIYAPADPLLMEHASSWSETTPYLIRGIEESLTGSDASFNPGGPNLPLEAINDKADRLIKMNTVELPNFLQR